jgi:DNA polymerase/3'-5' exonuclease PolX
MSEGARIPRIDALALADQLVILIGPYCERIQILGSLRRLRPDVGDIELLTIPRLVDRVDMFGLPTGDEDCLFDRCVELLAKGIFQHRPDKHGRPAFGFKYKRLSYEEVALDLFSVLPPAQWGVLSVIRTGSAEFSHRLVTPVEQGGWMPRGMYCRDGALWDATSGSAFETPEEEHVFAALGRPYVEPQDREV